MARRKINPSLFEDSSSLLELAAFKKKIKRLYDEILERVYKAENPGASPEEVQAYVEENGLQFPDEDVSEDTDADDVFAVGDELIACAANGTSAQVIGTVTAVTADTITTDGVGFDGALADDDEVCFRSPITLRLGLEY